MLHRNPIARVQRILLVEPGRPVAEPGADVLHERAARAGDPIPPRAQPAAERQRGRKVVSRLDHEAVPEAVPALVVEEALPANPDAEAEPASSLSELRLRGDPDEGALQDSVVVAGRARRGALGERPRHVSVVARVRRRADRVDDAVAVALDVLVSDEAPSRTRRARAWGRVRTRCSRRPARGSCTSRRSRRAPSRPRRSPPRPDETLRRPSRQRSARSSSCLLRMRGAWPRSGRRRAGPARTSGSTRHQSPRRSLRPISSSSRAIVEALSAGADHP